ncbi:MAG: hypothetical protein R3D44_02540 [Hyphomicrobiaceae bacterium]
MAWGFQRLSQLARRAARVTAPLSMVGFLATSPVAAGHDVFHIFSPTVEAGHWDVEALSAFAFKRPVPEVGEHAAPRAAAELGVHAGVTDFWMAKLALGAEREEGGSLALTAVALENVFRFTRTARGPVDFAWFTAVGAGLGSESTNAVEFGPIVSYAAGPTSLVLNPFFEKTFGKNHEEGIAFTYAWRLAHQIARQLSVGLEGYGEIENIGNAPDVQHQVHRIGPVLYLGSLHGAQSSPHGHGASASTVGGHDHNAHAGQGLGEWRAEIGVLFGLTEATPGTALKLNVGLEF